MTAAEIGYSRIPDCSMQKSNVFCLPSVCHFPHHPCEQNELGSNMATKTKRAALYLRVSTDGQTTDNQRLALEQICAQRGWNVVAIFEDNGISGAKGRDKRPGLDKLLKDATRGRFDVAMAWALDRLGRSLIDLLESLRELD